MKTSGLEAGVDSNENRWELYETDGIWRWRKSSEKGRVVEGSGRVFANMEDCEADTRDHGMDISLRLWRQGNLALKVSLPPLILKQISTNGQLNNGLRMLEDAGRDYWFPLRVVVCLDGATQ